MKLTERQLEVISRTVAEVLVRQQEEDKKQAKDRRFQNTVLLLKNYRGLLAHCEGLKHELSEFEKRSIQDLDLDEITLESIESIKKSRTKTIAMVMFIQLKVKIYKSMCTEEEQLKFRLLEKKYINPYKMSNRQIIESESIDKSTFYRNLNKATEEIGVLFFGIDAVDLK